MSAEQDVLFMKRALSLAERGRPFTNPNPLVGCVVARGKQTVGEGWHRRFGGPHAEVEALKQAGSRSRGATLYVNLEPCSHWGKTPPCASAVQASGVRRVVVSLKDPNPSVSGRGLRALRKAGIRVDVGLLKSEAFALNRPFLTAQTRQRPYVTLKIAQTLDGKVASFTGKSRWITGSQARSYGHKLRADSDAILVGAETVRKDNPSLTSHGAGPNPVRIVISASLNLPANAKVFNADAPTWIITGEKASPARQKAFLSRGVQILKYSMKNASINLKDVFNDLWKIGLHKVFVEGGPTLSSALLRDKLVDEIYIFTAPRFLGGSGALSSVAGQGWADPQAGPQLRDMEILPVGPDFLIHGMVA